MFFIFGIRIGNWLGGLRVYTCSRKIYELPNVFFKIKFFRRNKFNKLIKINTENENKFLSVIQPGSALLFAPKNSKWYTFLESILRSVDFTHWSVSVTFEDRPCPHLISQSPLGPVIFLWLSTHLILLSSSPNLTECHQPLFISSNMSSLWPPKGLCTSRCFCLGALLESSHDFLLVIQNSSSLI